MRRAGLACAALGALCLGALWLVGGWAAAASYLAAWLLGFGVAVGGLVLAMAAEAAGGVSAPARAVSLAVPLMALLAAPLLIDLAHILPASPGWFAPPSVRLRSLVVLALMSLLALAFLRRPARPRVALAAFGLMVAVVAISVLSFDMVLSLTLQFGSAAFGLLFLASCCAAAAALASLLSGSGATVLTVALAAWAFLQFTQFLVVWSANLPVEAAWYLTRDAGLGRAAEWAGIGAALAALLLLLVRDVIGGRFALPAAAALVLLAHVVETFWLVTPALRGSLRLEPNDVLAACGIAFVLAGLILSTHRREARHAAA